MDARKASSPAASVPDCPSHRTAAARSDYAVGSRRSFSLSASRISARQADHHHAIALPVTEDGAAPGRHGDVLDTVELVADRRCVDPRSAIERPQALAGLRMERAEVAVAFPGKHDIA